jgi:hypothetical protein
MARHQLIVEGQDEDLLFTYLLRETPNVEIHSLNGRDNLAHKLRQVAKRNPEELASVIVVLDAEDSTAQSFRSVSDALSRSGFARPSAPDRWAGTQPPVLVSLLPANSESGCLEDLFLQAWAATAEAEMQCLRRLRECWVPTNITEAKWSKIFANVILRAKDGNDDFGVGRALKNDHFNDLFSREPMTQLTALVERIVRGPDA